MAILSNTALANPSRGYDIEQSLRFNDGDTPYLSWTPGSAGSQNLDMEWMDKALNSMWRKNGVIVF